MVEDERAHWLWLRLARAFPRALSCVFMPDHLHLESEPGARERLRTLLNRYTTRFGVRLDLADPEPGNSPAIVTRQMRYQLFNPVRAGLVDDPWRWRWSTLRDLGKACEPVWTPLSAVAATLEQLPQQVLHRLTSLGDHDVPPLHPVLPLVATIDGIVAAVVEALRDAQALRSPRGRRLVVQASYAVGTPSPRMLAAALDCTVRTIHRLRAPAARGLDAVLQCLADPRLREATP